MAGQIWEEDDQWFCFKLNSTRSPQAKNELLMAAIGIKFHRISIHFDGITQEIKSKKDVLT